MREGELGVDIGRAETMVGDVEEPCLVGQVSALYEVVE